MEPAFNSRCFRSFWRAYLEQRIDHNTFAIIPKFPFGLTFSREVHCLLLHGVACPRNCDETPEDCLRFEMLLREDPVHGDVEEALPLDRQRGRLSALRGA